MRIPRIFLKVDGSDQFFHLISRVANKQFLLNDRAKMVFVSYLRRYEAFSGCQVLTYCLMDNHFHLLLKVPKRPETIPCEEVERRLTHIMNDTKMQSVRARIELLSTAEDKSELESYLDTFRKRMFDLSFFMKDLKQRFTQWYNHEFEHEGTLWESRFTSIIVSNSSQALLRVASYIDLNPVRAGMVEDPADYPWGIFGDCKNGLAHLRYLCRYVGEADHSIWRGMSEPDFFMKYHLRLKVIIGLDRNNNIDIACQNADSLHYVSQSNENHENEVDPPHAARNTTGQQNCQVASFSIKDGIHLKQGQEKLKSVNFLDLDEYSGFSIRKQSHLYRRQY